MDTHTDNAANPPWADELGERARSLGLTLWYAADASGPCIRGGNDVATRWFTGKLLHKWVVAAASPDLTPDEGGQPPVVEIFPGCSCAVLATPDQAAVTVVAIALKPDAYRSPQFASLCADVCLPVAEAIDGLRSLFPAGPVDLMTAGLALKWGYEDLVRQDRDAETLDAFGEELAQSFEEINVLFRLTRLTNQSDQPAALAAAVLAEAHQSIRYHWISAKFLPVDAVVPDLRGAFILAGEPDCPRADLERVIAQTLAEPAGIPDRPLDPDAHPLAALIRAEAIVYPISHAGRTVGLLAAGNKYARCTDPTSGDMRFLQSTADSLGLFHENLARFERQRELFFGTLQALTSAIDAKDRYTCGHSARVAWLASRIATAMGLPADVSEQARIAGLVHDVGKIGIPESVLCKSGRLTDEEFGLIKSHPMIGHNMLRHIAPLADMLPGVLYHHERWDGKGYPEGRSGLDIPLMGRILAVADTFDAMSSTRSYRAGLTREIVLAEIIASAGRQLDPAAALAFGEVDLSGYEALLSASETHRPAAAA